MNNQHIKRIVRAALKEDIGAGDVTTVLSVPADRQAEAVIFFKENAVIAGLQFVREIFRTLDPQCRFHVPHRDGERVRPRVIVFKVKGKARAILTGERVALNFLSYLSSIATETRRYCDAVRPYKVDILDTRKTTPTLRWAERYAVRVGGGVNHRFDLGEMVLVKDNHRMLNRFETLAEMLHDIHKGTHKRVEIEVDRLDELEDVLRVHPQMILLDNMSVAELRQAVKMTRKLPPSRRPLLEASGGVTLENVKAVASTGVDRISIGALTHSRRVIDLSLEILS